VSWPGQCRRSPSQSLLCSSCLFHGILVKSVSPWKPSLKKRTHKVCRRIFKTLNLRLYRNHTDHRIIECIGLERTFRAHLAQFPCSDQGHLQLDLVVQSPIQPGLEFFQGWGLHYPSAQSVPEFYHPYRKEFFPYIQSKSTFP